MPLLTFSFIHLLYSLKAKARLILKTKFSGRVTEKNRKALTMRASWQSKHRSNKSTSAGARQRCSSQRGQTVHIKNDLFTPLTNAGEATPPVCAGCLKD
jgi:hypothetical protein